MKARLDPVLPLLVTRAADDAAPLVASLRQAGLDAIAAPCLAYAALPFDLSPFRGRPADVLLTSPRAVAALPPPDPLWRLLALSPASAHAVRARGLQPDVVASGGAAALAALARPGLLLHPTSDHGGAETLRVRPDAVIIPIYQTVCPERLPEAALAAMEGPFQVVFFSPSAVHNFGRLSGGRIPSTSWYVGETTGAALSETALSATGRSWPGTPRAE